MLYCFLLQQHCSYLLLRILLLWIFCCNNNSYIAVTTAIAVIAVIAVMAVMADIELILNVLLSYCCYILQHQ